jgi:ATP synthase protein I
MATNERAERRRRADGKRFTREIDAKARRKIKGRQERQRSPWFWAGMFGLVGWSVAVPAALGVYLGLKMQQWYPGRFSWPLTGGVVGMTIGCLNAWFWVRRESREES